MPGYLIHHRSHPYDGILADYYRNDPYVWFSPYLWSFCHLNQRPRVEVGMTVLWLSKADRTFVCDLVFVVAQILLFQQALARYESQDAELAQRHFRQGMQYHPEVARPEARTYVADMRRSYIPHPAVRLEAEIDAVRQRETPSSKPLAIAWGKQTSPLRVDGINELERVVHERSRQRLFGPLGPGGMSPGQAAALR